MKPLLYPLLSALLCSCQITTPPVVNTNAAFFKELHAGTIKDAFGDCVRVYRRDFKRGGPQGGYAQGYLGMFVIDCDKVDEIDVDFTKD